MGIEQRQLLMAVNGVGRVIDVEGNGFGGRRVAPHHRSTIRLRQPYQGAQIWRVLPARHSGLRGQVSPLSGRRPQASLNAGSVRSSVQVIGIRIAAGNREDARTQNVAQACG